MRLTSLLTAITGLAVAGGSVYVARDMLAVRSADASAAVVEASTVTVIVASRDIAFGQAIESHMLTTIDWPRDAVPDGVYIDYAQLLPTDGGDPRRARRALATGELLLASKVSDFGEKVTIVQTLSPNSRAMAIKVSAETAVGGFVTPGDFVDVVLTQGRDEAMRAVTILQNIRVVGVDQQSDELEDNPEVARTVTVEVTAEQGQKLALAQNVGTLSLTLRSLESEEDAPLESVRVSDLLQELSPVPEGQKTTTITVRRGVEVQDIN